MHRDLYYWLENLGTLSVQICVLKKMKIWTHFRKSMTDRNCLGFPYQEKIFAYVQCWHQNCLYRMCNLQFWNSWQEILRRPQVCKKKVFKFWQWRHAIWKTYSVIHWLTHGVWRNNRREYHLRIHVTQKFIHT